MNTRTTTKLIHEGDYVAEVDVELFDTDRGWSPYLTLDEALKLDDVRELLRQGRVRDAAKQARVYSLHRVAV